MELCPLQRASAGPSPSPLQLCWCHWLRDLVHTGISPYREELPLDLSCRCMLRVKALRETLTVCGLHMICYMFLLTLMRLTGATNNVLTLPVSMSTEEPSFFKIGISTWFSMPTLETMVGREALKFTFLWPRLEMSCHQVTLWLVEDSQSQEGILKCDFYKVQDSVQWLFYFLSMLQLLIHRCVLQRQLSFDSS